MGKLCIDSNILIDFLRGEKNAAETVRKARGKYVLCTTACNAFEVFLGTHLSKTPGGPAAASKLINALQVLDLTRPAAEKAAEIGAAPKKKGQTLPLGDLLIAGTALENNCILLTEDKKHFEKIPGLTLF